MSGFIKTTCPSCGHTSLTPKSDDGVARPCNNCGTSFERKTKVELDPVEDKPFPETTPPTREVNPLPFRPKAQARIYPAEEEASKKSPFLYINILLVLGFCGYFFYPQLSKLKDSLLGSNSKKNTSTEIISKIEKVKIPKSKPLPWELPKDHNLWSFAITKDGKAFYSTSSKKGDNIYIEGNLIKGGVSNPKVSESGSYIYSLRDKKSKVRSIYVNGEKIISNNKGEDYYFPSISSDGSKVSYQVYTKKNGKKINFSVIDGESYENHNLYNIYWVGDNSYIASTEKYYFYNGKKYLKGEFMPVLFEGEKSRHMDAAHVLFSTKNEDDSSGKFSLYFDGKFLFKYSSYLSYNSNLLNLGIADYFKYKLDSKEYVYFKGKTYGPFSRTGHFYGVEWVYGYTDKGVTVFLNDNVYEIEGESFGRFVLNNDKTSFLVSYTKGEEQFISETGKATKIHGVRLKNYFFFGEKLGYSYIEDSKIIVNIDGEIFNHPRASVQIQKNGEGFIYLNSPPYRKIITSKVEADFLSNESVSVINGYLLKREVIDKKSYYYLEKGDFQSKLFSTYDKSNILQKGDKLVIRVKLKGETVYRLLINGKPTRYTIDSKQRYGFLENSDVVFFHDDSIGNGIGGKFVVVEHEKLSFDKMLYGPFVRGDNILVYYMNGKKIYKSELSISKLSKSSYKGDIKLVTPEPKKIQPSSTIKKKVTSPKSLKGTTKERVSYPVVNDVHKRVLVTKELLEDSPIRSFNPFQGQILYGEKEINLKMLFIMYFDQKLPIDSNSIVVEMDDVRRKGRKNITHLFKLGKLRSSNKSPISLPVVRSDGILKVNLYVHFKRKNKPLKEYKMSWPVYTSNYKTLPVIFNSNRTWLEMGKVNNISLYGFNLKNLKKIELVHQKTGKTFPVRYSKRVVDLAPENYIQTGPNKVASISAKIPVSLAGLHYFKVEGVLQKHLPLMALPINYTKHAVSTEGDVNVNDVIRDLNRDGIKSGHDLLCLLNPPKNGEYSIREAVYVIKKLIEINPRQGMRDYNFLDQTKKEIKAKAPSLETDPFSDADPFSDSDPFGQ